MKRIYYQRLAIPINELENKRQFKCGWMAAPPRGKEEKELEPEDEHLIGYSWWQWV